MLYRLLVPLLFMLGPRVLPHLLRYIRLVWRLTFDKRVSIFLRALIPLAIIYALSPLDLVPDWWPILGRLDDLIILALAVLVLTKLAPQHIIDEHLGKQPPAGVPQEKDPSKVVEGTAHIVDDE